MALTAAKLAEIATLDPTRPGALGKLEALLRQLPRHGDPLAAAQRTLIERLLSVAPIERPGPPTTPFDKPVSTAAHSVPLTAADVAWLQRLPTDPAAVSDHDVVELRRLEQRAEPRSGDARLIGSILAPIRAHHDGWKARATADLVRTDPPPPVNPGVQDVLAETIAAEAGIPKADAAGRAHALVAQLTAERAAAYARAVAAADAVVPSGDAA